MSNKQFKSALRRLHKGISIFRKDHPAPGYATFTVEYSGVMFRGVIRSLDGEVIEIWEVPRLDWLRRIAVGYYPSIAKAIGPARNFIGV